LQGKGKSREKGAPIRPNEGEAALYDIFYDDTEYDYMQHLRPTGAPEAIFVPAPRTQQKPAKDPKDVVTLVPKESLPTESADERPYAELMGIPEKPFGLQPDMDPRLREVLEALEDEEYVVDDKEDNPEDFFSGLVESGERGAKDVFEDDDEEGNHDSEIASGWQQEMAKFRKPALGSDDDEDFGSEGGDTIGELPETAPRRSRRKVASDAGSGLSMSSSALFRNAGLQTLDERFDAVRRLSRPLVSSLV
jgi:protein LTV1